MLKDKSKHFSMHRFQTTAADVLPQICKFLLPSEVSRMAGIFKAWRTACAVEISAATAFGFETKLAAETIWEERLDSRYEFCTTNAQPAGKPYSEHHVARHMYASPQSFVEISSSRRAELLHPQSGRDGQRPLHTFYFTTTKPALNELTVTFRRAFNKIDRAQPKNELLV